MNRWIWNMSKDEPPRVLIVDDEVEILALMRELFEARGFQVVVTSLAEEAVKLARETNFSAIIADLKMQGMDGVEIVNRLKAVQDPGKIIVMSGYGTQVQDSLEKAGVEHYVVKPIDFDQLLDKVKTITSPSERGSPQSYSAGE